MQQSRVIGLMAPFLLLLFLLSAAVFWRGQSREERARHENQDPCRPIVRATERGDIDETRRLLSQGCSPNYRRPGVLSAPQDRSVRQQLQARKDRSRFAGTPLLELAAQNNNVPLLRLLVERGADVNARGIYRYTALMRAAGRANVEATAFLLEAGAKPDLRDTLFGETALHKATRSAGRRMRESPAMTERRRKTALLLLRHGADQSISDERGRKPLDGFSLK